ncbi:MAG: BamA/TamA family outer membrane protein, partial [Bacteroidota bacterium]
STNLYGLTLYLENFDYRFNPRKGYSILMELASGIKNISVNPNINSSLYEGIDLKSNQLESRFIGKIFIPIIGNLICKVENNTGYIQNDHLFKNELFQIGGLKFLRGFDEKSLFASAYSVFSVEPRFIFEQNSCLFAFLDYGFYEERLNQYTRDNPLGIGIGLDFDTNAGIFTIIYAIGKQFDNSFDFQAAKIHFGYLNRF